MISSSPNTTAPSPFADFRRFFAGAVHLRASRCRCRTSGLGWLVYERTQSALAWGMVGLAAFLPALLLAFVTGAVADRYRPPVIRSRCCIAIASRRPASSARPDAACSGLADLCADRGLRHGAGLRQPRQPGAAAQPRAGAATSQRGRVERLGLADGHHRGPGRGRPALRHRPAVVFGVRDVAFAAPPLLMAASLQRARAVRHRREKPSWSQPARPASPSSARSR